MSTPRVSEPHSRARAPVIVAWLVLMAATQLPYLSASLEPPPGTVFIGAFHWLDDIQNYLSFVQQAEDGHVAFVNKLYSGPHAPAMVSPEFWLVGRVSALIGHRPFLAFRLVGMLAALALLAALDRILRRAGVSGTHRLPALLLVATGGGLGAVLLFAFGFDLSRCLDLSSGLYPFAGFLSNPHWTVSTALLLWSLLLFESRNRSGFAAGVVLANLMGFTRPYEPVLLVGTLALSSLVEPTIRRRVLWLALGLLPWGIYQLWLSLFVPAFTLFTRLHYPPFPIPETLLALAPAGLLALLAFRAGPVDPGQDAMKRRLGLWGLLATSVLALRSPGSQSQMLVGLGLPLLALAAVGLLRFRARWTWAAALLLSGSAALSVLIVSRGDPHWFVPREQVDASLALRPVCRSGDVVFAPPQIGLLVNALTRCRAWVSHEAGEDYGPNLARLAAFYRPMDPAGRRALLDAACITHLALPGSSDSRPTAWLGTETDFTRSATTGAGARTISIYSRPRPSCPGA